jgi:hypothetical protein
MRLKDGDILLLGETKLELVDPREPRTVVEKPLGRRWPQSASIPRKRMLVAGAAALVLFAVFVRAEQGRRRERERQRQEQRLVQKKRQELEQYFQRGKNLIREGNWIAAKAEFEQAARIDSNFADLGEYLRRTEREIPNQRSLAGVEAALSKGELGNASAALAQVSSDTLQYERLAALQTAFAEKIKARVEEAHAALGARDYERTAILAEEILRASPANSDAKYLANVAREALDKYRVARAARHSVPTGPWRAAIKRFLDGDVSGAIAMVERCAMKVAKCESLANRMREFDELNKRLDFLDADNLRRLIALDRQILGGVGSSWSRKAKLRLSGVLVKTASSAQSAHDWVKAAKMAKEALRMDSGNVAAASILEDLRGKAKDVYLSAYTIRESDPAAALVRFEEVLQLTSPGDENYQRAKFWIEKLSK